MAANSLYPGFARINYTISSRRHRMTLPVKPFIGVGGGWWVEQKGVPTGTTFDTAINLVAAALVPIFHNATAVLVDAELWTLDAPDADPQWRETIPLNDAGGNGAAATAYAQTVVSLRSDQGGIFRIYLMEPSHSVNTIGQPSTYSAHAGVAGLVTLLTGSTSPVCARDGGWLIAGLRSMSKTNDALRKKYVVNA